jgi:hypothetical protein
MGRKFTCKARGEVVSCCSGGRERARAFFVCLSGPAVTEERRPGLKHEDGAERFRDEGSVSRMD